MGGRNLIILSDEDGKDDFFSIFIIRSTNGKEKKKKKEKASACFGHRLPYISSPFSSNVLNETFPFLTSGTWVFNPIALSKAMSNKEPRFQAHRSLSQPPLFSSPAPVTRPLALFPSCNHTTALFPRHLTLRYSLSLFHLLFFSFRPLSFRTVLFPLLSKAFERTRS